MSEQITTTPKGVATALSAFVIWGFFPLYFKLLKNYTATEIIAHRIIWTFLAILLLLIVLKKWQWLSVIKSEPKWLFFTFLSGAIIATNWLTYVWAVNRNQILEASLGYYISPLMGVLLSMVVLQEKLSIYRKIAVSLAFIGVCIQLIIIGKLPLVSLGLSLSFSVYGLMHRKNPLDALSAMFIETATLTPFVIIWLRFAGVASSDLSFWLSDSIWLLMLAGPITLLPLLMFNKATKMVAFNLLSFMNYLTPSIIFFMAIFLYHEPFDVSKLVTFGFIWVGLLFFSYDLVRKK